LVSPVASFARMMLMPLMRIGPLPLLEGRSPIISDGSCGLACQTPFNGDTTPPPRSGNGGRQDALADPCVECLHADPAQRRCFAARQRQRQIALSPRNGLSALGFGELRWCTHGLWSASSISRSHIAPPFNILAIGAGLRKMLALLEKNGPVYRLLRFGRRTTKFQSFPEILEPAGG
jgi:hypothetical protein